MAGWILTALLCAAVEGNTDCTLVMFTADWCQPCQQMRPSLDKLAQEGWQVQQVDTDRQPQLVQQFRVKNLPTLVIVSGGQEVDRMVGAAPYEQILQRAMRVASRSQSARPVPPTSAVSSTAQATTSGMQPIVRGQSPAASAFPMLASVTNAITDASSTNVVSSMWDPTPGNSATAASNDVRAQVALSREQAIGRASTATVRIRVDEANTTAYGTGTIIDVHGKEALILTCGHLFRDMKPNSQLTVDLFPGTPQEVNVPSQLIDFKAEGEDIGLISLELPVAIEPVGILPRGETLQIGQGAFSFGCDHGADPTRRDTKIKNVNRYVGAANVEIYGAPAVGRSGGGLFDEQGRLIGVCNAADATDDEGIYAAADVMYAQLARLKLEHLFDSHTGSQDGKTRLASTVVAPRQEQPLLAHGSGTLGTQSDLIAGGAGWPGEALAQGAVEIGDSPATSESPSQIICILRGQNGQDQVVTINSPTPTLLQHIRQHAGR